MSEVGYYGHGSTLAAYTVQLKQPEEWLRWKRQFEQFRVASRLEDDTRQVSTLLYCMGEEAGDVLSTTNITNDDCKKYDAVIQKYEFFQVRCNIIFKQARFNHCCYQQPGETTALYGLIKTCDYGALKDDLLCDRFATDWWFALPTRRSQRNHNTSVQQEELPVIDVKGKASLDHNAYPKRLQKP